MFTSLFAVFSTLLLGVSYLVNAAPVSTVKPVELLAFAPTITNPKLGTVWYTGTQRNVTWLTSNVPAEIQNTTVAILLGYITANSENLDYRNPLATQVPIMQGFAQVTVPVNATTRTNYTVIVLGDSGDASPPFTITSESNPLGGLL